MFTTQIRESKTQPVEGTAFDIVFGEIDGNRLICNMDLNNLEAARQRAFSIVGLIRKISPHLSATLIHESIAADAELLCESAAQMGIKNWYI